MRVYTPLELAGRNIYIREGCYACHSQMIRTLRDEVERYGPYSLAVESEIRPSDAVGLEAHRSGSRAHRRQIFRRMARGPSQQPARCRAGIGHARLSWLGRTSCAPTISARILQGAARRRRALYRRHDRQCAADAYGQAAPDTPFAEGVTKRYGEATNVRAFDGKPGDSPRWTRWSPISRSSAS